jgi:hypothetical protein
MDVRVKQFRSARAACIRRLRVWITIRSPRAQDVRTLLGKPERLEDRVHSWLVLPCGEAYALLSGNASVRKSGMERTPTSNLDHALLWPGMPVSRAERTVA